GGHAALDGASGPAAPGVAQLNRADGHDTPKHVFELASQQRDVLLSIERARERRDEIAKPATTIAAARLAADGCDGHVREPVARRRAARARRTTEDADRTRQRRDSRWTRRGCLRRCTARLVRVRWLGSAAARTKAPRANQATSGARFRSAHQTKKCRSA